ncbi:MAG: hypothetical protein F4W91_23460 [Gemmatimonadetes bacterium]|nr:hypothetical protein [Gemmatimonadota bacterium]
MRRTYKAILRDDRIEWLDGSPETAEPISVDIIILDKAEQELSQAKEKTAGELLAILAEKDTFADIKDPVVWQREQRKDRPLPHRDTDAD